MSDYQGKDVGASGFAAGQGAGAGQGGSSASPGHHPGALAAPASSAGQAGDRDALREAVIAYWGERCPEHDADCPCCQSWAAIDLVSTPTPEGDLISRALPADTAPKDGSLLRLLVDYSGPHDQFALDDALQSWTIGFNNLSDTGTDEWHIAGWCWSQDCFTDGQGTVIGWLPFHDQPSSLTAPQPQGEDWDAAARDMLATWDEWFGGQSRARHYDAKRLLLAAGFAAQAFEDAASSPLTYDSAPGQLLRAFLLALVDQDHADLDHLRACNRVPAPPAQSEPVGGYMGAMAVLHQGMRELAQKPTTPAPVSAGVDLWALLREGCDLISVEVDALKAGISVNGEILADLEDAATLAAIAEFEGWIARCAAALRTPPPASAPVTVSVDLASGPDQTVVTLLNPSQAVLDVLAERQRQISAEGWTPEHDDQHVLGELGLAAALYALPYEAETYDGVQLLDQDDFIGLHMKLEIACQWTLKSEPNIIRRKVKAAALMLADLERLYRLTPPPASAGEGGARVVYEPYPGAFDHILGPDAQTGGAA